MGIFIYKARNNKGEYLEGQIESSALKQGVIKLQQLGLYVIDIKELKKTIIPFIDQEKIKQKDLLLLCKQLSFLLQAGTPLLAGLNIIYNHQTKLNMKTLLKSLMNEIELGFSFSDACANYPKVIPQIMINMLAAGETGGFLDQSLERLAKYFERQLEIKGKIITAISYSFIVFVISIIFIFFLFGFIVPVFIEIVEDIGGTLSTGSKFFLLLGMKIAHNWYLLLGGMFIVYGFIKMLSNTSVGREIIDNLLLRIPFINIFVIRILLSSFCRDLGDLLKSGVPILNALEIIAKNCPNTIFKKDIKIAINNLTLGLSLLESFKDSRILTTMVIQMIAVGEQSGKLDFILLKTSDFYDDEISQLTERLPKLMEPLVLILLGVLVGFIILGLLIPMVNTMYNIGF